MTTNGASTNPFASRYINALPYRMPTANTQTLVSRLTKLGGRGAIVGPHGSGKTTLLENLSIELTRAGWTVHHFRTTERRRGIRDIASQTYNPEHAVLIDSAGHIGPLLWRRLSGHLAKAGRVVITAHRPGRLPLLHHNETSLDLLDALVAELAPATAKTLRPHAHALYAQHAGNIRDVLRGLYDHCSARRNPAT